MTGPFPPIGIPNFPSSIWNNLIINPSTQGPTDYDIILTVSNTWKLNDNVDIQTITINPLQKVTSRVFLHKQVHLVL